MRPQLATFPIPTTFPAVFPPLCPPVHPPAMSSHCSPLTHPPPLSPPHMSSHSAPQRRRGGQAQQHGAALRVGPAGPGRPAAWHGQPQGQARHQSAHAGRCGGAC
eukprot:354865-Chlamydomonas_euryale.AAC.7